MLEVLMSMERSFQLVNYIPHQTIACDDRGFTLRLSG